MDWVIDVAIMGMMGAIVGSFLSTLAVRWERRESILAGRSRCDGCGVLLPAYRLIPLLSYLALRGKCFHCGSEIDVRHLQIEVACAAVGIITTLTSPDLGGVAGAIFGWNLVVLARLDVDQFWLPDLLVLPLGLAGMATGALGNAPAFPDRALGLVLGAILLGSIKIVYRVRFGRTGLGSGDVKLCGALGAWVGASGLPATILIASCGGIAWTAWKARAHKQQEISKLVPFGTYLCLGAGIVWLWQHRSGF